MGSKSWVQSPGSEGVLTSAERPGARNTEGRVHIFPVRYKHVERGPPLLVHSKSATPTFHCGKTYMCGEKGKKPRAEVEASTKPLSIGLKFEVPSWEPLEKWGIVCGTSALGIAIGAT